MYRFRMWCIDCKGVDVQGCWSGGYSDWSKEYASLDQCVADAEETIGDGVWDYEVFDENGEVSVSTFPDIKGEQQYELLP